jgi:hypothetical protein
MKLAFRSVVSRPRSAWPDNVDRGGNAIALMSAAAGIWLAIGIVAQEQRLFKEIWRWRT